MSNREPEAQQHHFEKRIFAIETSCDETAISIVDFTKDSYTVRSHLVESQNASHAPFGGVVPEVASRDHLAKIGGLAKQALEESQCKIATCTHIAVTMGPGLIGPIMVGVLFARGLSASTGIPLIAVNHVDAHLAPCFFGENFSPNADVGTRLQRLPCHMPALALTISGGHCHLSHLATASQRLLLGATLDDACGEAFDKVAKLLGLPYPGGPLIEVLAAQGKDRPEWKFPKTLSDPLRPLDFSFSGLKTSVLERVRKELGNPKGKIDGSSLSNETKADIAYNFQEAALFQLWDRLKNGLAHCQKSGLAQPQIVLVAGGVAANSRFRQMALSFELPVHFAPRALCGDNATMIALQAELCPVSEGLRQPFSRYADWNVLSEGSPIS